MRNKRRRMICLKKSSIWEEYNDKAQRLQVKPDARKISDEKYKGKA